MYYKKLKLLLFIFSLFTSLLMNSNLFASTGQCNVFNLPSRLPSLMSFAVPLQNKTLSMACCGENKNSPGYYLSTKKNYGYDACLLRYKNGLPKSQTDNKFGFVECIGASMTGAYESIKDSLSSLWGIIKNPLEFASDLSELGKILIDSKGREKLYKFIKKSIQDQMGNMSQCLSKDELDEEVCKVSGQFVANFIPPALMVKAIVKSVKLGKVTKELSTAITASMKKSTTPVAVPVPLAPARSTLTFSQAQIRRNSLLPPRERIAAFEKLLGLKAGSLANNKNKSNAILAAHNLSGSVGKLTFSQIRQRVRLLRSKGFTDKEIRMGLDAGIFGHLESTPMSRQTVLSALPKADAKLSSAKVVTRIPSTKHDSGQSLFQGDNNDGIDILSIDGQKVFSKIKFDPKARDLSPEQIRIIQDSFVNESKYAKKMSDLGVGPKYYGSTMSADGKFSLATEFVEGFEVHLGDSVADIKKLKLSTIYEMKQKALKVVENGIDPFDLQFRVDKNGVPFIVDPEHFSVLDPKSKAQIIKDIESDFTDLINQKKMDRK